jgi:hypothetical protein
MCRCSGHMRPPLRPAVAGCLGLKGRSERRAGGAPKAASDSILTDRLAAWSHRQGPMGTRAQVPLRGLQSGNGRAGSSPAFAAAALLSRSLALRGRYEPPAGVPARARLSLPTTAAAGLFPLRQKATQAIHPATINSEETDTASMNGPSAGGGSLLATRLARAIPVKSTARGHKKTARARSRATTSARRTTTDMPRPRSEGAKQGRPGAGRVRPGSRRQKGSPPSEPGVAQKGRHGRLGGPLQGGRRVLVLDRGQHAVLAETVADRTFAPVLVVEADHHPGRSGVPRDQLLVKARRLAPIVDGNDVSAGHH